MHIYAKRPVLFGPKSYCCCHIAGQITKYPYFTKEKVGLLGIVFLLFRYLFVVLLCVCSILQI